MGIEQNDRELFISGDEGADFIPFDERGFYTGQKKDHHGNRNRPDEFSFAERGGALCYHRRLSSG